MIRESSTVFQTMLSAGAIGVLLSIALVASIMLIKKFDKAKGIDFVDDSPIFAFLIVLFGFFIFLSFSDLYRTEVSYRHSVLIGQEWTRSEALTRDVLRGYRQLSHLVEVTESDDVMEGDMVFFFKYGDFHSGNVMSAIREELDERKEWSVNGIVVPPYSFIAANIETDVGRRLIKRFGITVVPTIAVIGKDVEIVEFALTEELLPNRELISRALDLSITYHNELLRQERVSEAIEEAEQHPIVKLD